jgi:hypothetical protein
MIERTWPDPAEYAAANSLLSADDPLLRDYLEHFLVDGRVRLSPDVLIADASDVFFGRSRWRKLAVPTWLVYAEWSVDRKGTPAYSPEAAAAFQAALPCLAPPRRVTGVDHGGLLWTKTGATAVVAVLEEVPNQPR